MPDPAVHHIVRIVLLDDHEMIRDSMGQLLDAHDEFQVVACVSDPERAVELAVKEQPDVIVMDIDLPGALSFDAASRIASLQPDIRIVFLSAFCYDHYIEKAIQLNARGYLTKAQSTHTIVDAIRQVARGRTCFSDDVRSRLVIDDAGPRLQSSSTTRLSTLTEREVEVLRFIAKGGSKREIARDLHISVKTVDGHAAKVMKKLQIHDRVELARYAIREGLVSV